MNKKTKSFFYNLFAFAIIFFPIRYLLLEQFMMSTMMKPLIAFVVATILAPKFQVVKIGNEEKIFMKWIFSNGVREIK